MAKAKVGLKPLLFFFRTKIIIKGQIIKILSYFVVVIDKTEQMSYKFAEISNVIEVCWNIYIKYRQKTSLQATFLDSKVAFHFHGGWLCLPTLNVAIISENDLFFFLSGAIWQKCVFLNSSVKCY